MINIAPSRLRMPVVEYATLELTLSTPLILGDTVVHHYTCTVKFMAFVLADYPFVWIFMKLVDCLYKKQEYLQFMCRY